MLIEISGWTGMVLILVAFYLVSSKKVVSDSVSYQLMNFLGAIGIIVNTFYNQAWPAMTLNIIWALIALKTLLSSKRSANNVNE